jgi:hypothetical protein
MYQYRRSAGLILWLGVMISLVMGGCQPKNGGRPEVRVIPEQAVPCNTPINPVYMQTACEVSEVKVKQEIVGESIPNGWIPPNNLENRKRWEGIVIHHSATDIGSATYIDDLHRGNGWDGLGYDFLIDNGTGGEDGKIEVGWRWRQQREGAHCRVNPSDDNYWNEHTVGICVVGNFEIQRPTEAQWQSLVKVVRFLEGRYGFGWDRVKCHREIVNTRCPGRYLTLGELRERMGR